jgi:endo-1,4-beta-xylanase
MRACNWYLLLITASLTFGVSVFCDAQSLRYRADAAHILVGAAVRPERFPEAAYSETLGREFNLLEPENAMKWEAIRPSRDTFNFSAGDKVVGFAREHRMKVRGHTLVWGIHNPTWLQNGHFTAPELSAILHEHISKVMRHYRGQVFAWDVLNEALDDRGELRSSPWYDQPGIGLSKKGTAYIELMFRWAHEADPDALLFYNDNGGEELNVKSDAIYKMAKDFKARGVPIGGIGLQMHIAKLTADVQSISANIRRLSDLGLEVHFTEMDVALPVDPAIGEPHPADLIKQAELYHDLVCACTASQGCRAIQIWGFTDKYSWIRSHSKGKEGAALLFDRSYHPKPAYAAVSEALSPAQNGKCRQRVTAKP